MKVMALACVHHEHDVCAFPKQPGTHVGVEETREYVRPPPYPFQRHAKLLYTDILLDSKSPNPGST